MIRQLRVLAWRHAPGLCHAVSIRLPRWRVFWSYGWRRRRRRRFPDGPVVLAGFHGAVLGLGEAARGAVTALNAGGVPARAWDISEILGHQRRLDVGDATPPPPGPGVVITTLNPPELLRLLSLTGSEPFEGKRSIGYWSWELPDLPNDWKLAFRYVDEVWAISEFTAQAIRRSAPRGLPVKVAPLGVSLHEAQPAHARFGLDPDRVIVLNAFDLRSTLARKNPLAALEAFRRATALAQRPATLVLKTVGGDVAPDSLAALRAAIGDTPDVVVLTESLPPDARDQLMASCDIFLSLHRAEGFGLLLAEAMAARKAVVATGWSGNMDFMDAESAVLVPHDLTPVQDDQGLYKHGLWAEADVDFAARALARLIDDPAERHALGLRARARIERTLGPQVLADHLRDLLYPNASPSTPPSTPKAQHEH